MAQSPHPVDDTPSTAPTAGAHRVDLFVADHRLPTRDPTKVSECVIGERTFSVVLVPKPDAPLLSERQCEVARLVGKGLGNKGIACHLGISERTVANHLKEAFQRIGVTSRAELARWVSFGLL